MGKRADTLETALLAIELLRRVPRNHKITASELHRQLENAGIHRDLRTIQRQLDTLSEHFNLIRDDRSKPYGYQWRKHSGGLSIPNLSLQESLLLRLAEQHLRFLLPVHLMKSMEGFFAQARQNLGPNGARITREGVARQSARCRDITTTPSTKDRFNGVRSGL